MIRDDLVSITGRAWSFRVRRRGPPTRERWRMCYFVAERDNDVGVRCAA